MHHVSHHSNDGPCDKLNARDRLEFSLVDSITPFIMPAMRTLTNSCEFLLFFKAIMAITTAVINLGKATMVVMPLFQALFFFLFSSLQTP